MRVRYINNDGSGFAEWVEVAHGTLVSHFFSDKMGEEVLGSDYKIRVNGQPVTRDQSLQDGDRVSVFPKKMAGAR